MPTKEIQPVHPIGSLSRALAHGPHPLPLASWQLSICLQQWQQQLGIHVLLEPPHIEWSPLVAPPFYAQLSLDPGLCLVLQVIVGEKAGGALGCTAFVRRRNLAPLLDWRSLCQKLIRRHQVPWHTLPARLFWRQH